MTLRVLRTQRGFTLPELLVACAMIGIVMLGLFSILNTGQRSYLAGTNQVEAQQALRLALTRLSNEIREAGYCPTCGTGSPAITAFPAITGATGVNTVAPTSTALTIQNDWDANWNGTTSTIATSGTVTQTVMASGSNTTSNVTRGEQIRYAFSSGNLTRQEIGIDGSPVIVASNLASLTFTYLDASGTAFTPTVSNQGNIRTIVVNAVGQPQVQAASTAYGKVQLSMTDSLRLRNRAQ